MKRNFVILLLIVILSVLPSYADLNFTIAAKGENKVFTYHIPEETEDNVIEDEATTVQEDIVSDDITADTSATPNYDDSESENEYLVDDLYSDVLKGYASYDEVEEEEGIVLSPDLDVLTLNITKPVKVGIKNFSGLKTGESLYDNIYTKFNGTEYEISPINSTHTSKKYSGFSAGTSYEQEISYGELEQTSGVFSRYEYKRFALTTSYSKTVNTTNNNYNDKFSFAPEIRLNQYMVLKNKFSADTVKKRKKAEIILSINPFGKKDLDRLKFDFSASETYDEVSNSFWNRFEINSTFKL